MQIEAFFYRRISPFSIVQNGVLKVLETPISDSTNGISDYLFKLSTCSLRTVIT